MENYLERLNAVISKYGKETVFLGKGTEGSVWKIDRDFVIKLHRYPILWSEFPLKDMELRVYESGSLDDIFWVIREFLVTPEKCDLEYFENAITEAYCSLPSDLKLEDLHKVNITKASEYHQLEGKYDLKDSWYRDLTVEIAYKILTLRDMDLHAENLGFRISDRRPIFFDW